MVKRNSLIFFPLHPAVFPIGVILYFFLFFPKICLGNDLTGAFALGYQNNPTIAAARAAVAAAAAALGEANAAYWPTLDVTGSTGKNRETSRIYGLETKEQTSPDSISLNVRKNLYRGGGVAAEIRGRRQLLLAERMQLRSVEQQVFLKIAEAYFGVLRSKDIVRYSGEVVEGLRLLSEAVDARLGEGFATAAMQAQVRSRLELATARLRKAEGELQGALALYLETVGVAAGNLSPQQVFPPLPDNKLRARETALRQNPALLYAQHLQAVAEEEIITARAGRLPSVDFSFSVARRNDESDAVVRVEEVSTMLSAKLPLFYPETGFRIRRAGALLAQRRSEVSAAAASVVTQVMSLWGSLTAEQARLAAAEQSTTAAIRSLEMTQAMFVEGMADISEHIEAQAAVLEARLEGVNAAYDRALTVYRLLAALGELTAEKLQIAPITATNGQGDEDAAL